VKSELVEPKRAAVKRCAAVRVAIALTVGLALSGCGGGNIKDLLKDSPSQSETDTE
jgi:hypothetical protein